MDDEVKRLIGEVEINECAICGKPCKQVVCDASTEEIDDSYMSASEVARTSKWLQTITKSEKEKKIQPRIQP